LLLNDHYDPNWNVRVDGQPEKVLRCNFIMRGVYLAAGRHTIEFRFQPPYGLLYVSLAAIGLALVVLTVVLVARPDASVAATVAPTLPAREVAREMPAPACEASRPPPRETPAKVTQKSASSSARKRPNRASARR